MDELKDAINKEVLDTLTMEDLWKSPHYGLKNLDKNQDIEMSPKDFQRYKRIYSEEFNKRKSKNIVKGFGLIGITAVVGTSFFFRAFSHGGDIYFGP